MRWWSVLPVVLVTSGCVWTNRPECTPRTCSSQSCGSLGDDGCGTRLECGACASGLCGASVCIEPAPEAEPAVRLVGRSRPRSDGSHKISFPGTTFEARFEGTAVSVRLEDSSPGGHTTHFVARVDNLEPRVIAVQDGEQLYELASGLPAGDHFVQLIKRTEGMVGSATFRGFDFQGGTLLAPPRARRRIVVIGDSITTGYGILGPGPSCAFKPEEEDATATYAALTARDLSAELVTVAAAGLGVLRNVDGADAETMFQVYDRANTYEPEPLWPASGDGASVVVIHLGTNDFGVGVPDRDAFVQRYLDLIAKVRAGAPTVPIVIALPPMLSDSFPREQQHRTQAREFLQAVVAGSQARGDPQVSMVEFEQPTAEEPYGCEWHPGPLTHRKMADVLGAHLKTLSW